MDFMIWSVYLSLAGVRMQQEGLNIQKEAVLRRRKKLARYICCPFQLDGFRD